MKKRLRKKLKLAEFQELGFFVSGSFNSLEEQELDIFFEKLVEFAEANKMQCGGGYNTEEFEVFVNTGRACGDNAAMRQAFVDFMTGAPKEIREFEATELMDAYYDGDCHDGDCDCGCH